VVFVLQMSQLNGNVLQYAADGYKEVVLAAVIQGGNAIKHAADNFKSDKEVVLAAVTRCGYALEYVNKTATMRSDRDFVLQMVQLNSYPRGRARPENTKKKNGGGGLVRQGPLRKYKKIRGSGGAGPFCFGTKKSVAQRSAHPQHKNNSVHTAWWKLTNNQLT